MPAQALRGVAYPGPGTAAGTLTFIPPHARTLWGWAGWFDLHMAEGLTLSTGPEAAPTHWRQQYLPMAPVPLEAGVPLQVTFRVGPAMGDRRGLEVHTEWVQGDRRGRGRHRVV